VRVFVTGGAGFIGSAVSRVLLDEGHDVTVLDNLSKGFRERVPEGARFIEGDLCDAAALPELLRGHDAVIHMAAFIEVGRSVREPVLFAENNTTNTVRLLEAMHQAGVGKIVYSSSATVYGRPQSLPIRETDPLGIQPNPYGASKVASEAFVAVYHEIFGFDATVLRYFNPYGPNELHEPETHVIPNMVRALLEGRAVPLYWRGEQVRDFIYIDDLARAHTTALKMRGLDYYNIGSETGTKIIDLLRLVAEAAGTGDPQIDDLGDRPGDIEASYAWSRKFAEATGWRAEVPLPEGLARTVEWFRARMLSS
jgi:UDP-glucose 4-epimerase